MQAVDKSVEEQRRQAHKSCNAVGCKGENRARADIIPVQGLQQNVVFRVFVGREPDELTLRGNRPELGSIRIIGRRNRGQTPDEAPEQERTNQHDRQHQQLDFDDGRELGARQFDGAEMLRHAAVIGKWNGREPNIDAFVTRHRDRSFSHIRN